ncbi:MAG: histidinol-phosphatase HisJ family protein [Lachnospiraceae bacterium]|nr:histidinol-phosphatase HisJ family protein [Lachnospiraceae bacterium]
MIFPDYHIHSSFSEDCDTDIKDIILSAKSKGVSSICITDHYDMDFPILKEDPIIRFDLDIQSYINTLIALKDNLSPDFDLRIGIELGTMPSTLVKLTDFVKNNPYFDFIIASTHIVDNMDPYYPSFYEGRSIKDAYRRYFEDELYAVTNFDSYDVYGHLDYILRYGRDPKNPFEPKDFMEIFEEIFKQIISKGKGIEINTGGLYKGLNNTHPCKEYLKLYKELGGEIITVGSDAHTTDKVGYGFDVAKDLLLDCGFNYYCTFKNRKATYNKIYV